MALACLGAYGVGPLEPTTDPGGESGAPDANTGRDGGARPDAGGTVPDSGGSQQGDSCLAIEYCLVNNHCESDACYYSCSATASSQALTYLNDLEACYATCESACASDPESEQCDTCWTQNGCDAKEQACYQDSEGASQVTLTNCGAIDFCCYATGCWDDDSGNLWSACLSQGNADAQALANALDDCYYNADTSCQSSCTDPSSAACDDCYTQACQSQLDACYAQ